jgi:desulfoferrodoxin-like iron-binding protein
MNGSSGRVEEHSHTEFCTCPFSFKCYILVAGNSWTGNIMTRVEEIYLCKVCGNKVKVLEAGKGTLVCCGKPMVCIKA